MIVLLWTLALAGGCAALALYAIRRAVPRLPEAPPGPDPRRVILVKPVLASDPETLERCRAWLRSAESYPGRVGVIFSTARAVEPALSGLAPEFPGIEVRVVSCDPHARRREPGFDKGHRLAAAGPEIDRMLGEEDAVLLLSDEDVSPLERDCVARLVAAAPAPGVAATITYPAASTLHATWWDRVGTTNMAFNNWIYATGSAYFGHLQSVVLGWTTVVWRSDLQRVGGLAQAAEDVGLGVALRRHGIRGRLFDPERQLAIFEHRPTWRAFWDQQVRWRALLRGCHPILVGLMVVLMALMVPTSAALLALAFQPSLAAAALVVSALAVQALTLGVPARSTWQIPAHELVALSTQLVGMSTRRIRWGPWIYRIDRGARVVAKTWCGASPAEEAGPAPVDDRGDAIARAAGGRADQPVRGAD